MTDVVIASRRPYRHRLVRQAASRTYRPQRPRRDRVEGRDRARRHRARRGRPRRLRQRHPHRAGRHVHGARRRDEGRDPEGDARLHRQPPLRHRRAGDRLRRAGDPDRRGERRARRRRRVDEPRAVLDAGRALGRADGRDADGRPGRRRADRPVRQDPHGRHGREPRRARVDLPRAPGRVRGPSPTAAPRPPARTGRFNDEIVPVDVKVKRETVAFDAATSTSARTSTPQRWRKLQPAFKATAPSPPATPRA